MTVEYTQKLNLALPDGEEQYNRELDNENLRKIDNFASLTPERALTSDKLTTGKNINGVNFDGTKNIISGLGVYSPTEIYKTNDIVYGVEEETIKIYLSLKDDNLGNAVTNKEYWKEVELGGGAGVQIGTIFATLQRGATYYAPTGAIPCQGFIYTKVQFEDFWNDFLITGRMPTCSFAEHDTMIAERGYCDMFAIDTVENLFKAPYILTEEYDISNNIDYTMPAGFDTLPLQATPFYAPNDGVLMIDIHANINDWSDCYVNDVKIPFSYYDETSVVLNECYYIPLSKGDKIYWSKSATIRNEALFYRYKQKRNPELFYYIQIANGQINQSDMDWSAWASGLETKVNINANNLSNQGKSLISGYSMPSNRYTNLELGASGSDYYAPANGWICLSKTATGNQDINMRNYTRNIWTYSYGTNGKWIHCYLPCQKGDQIHIEYTAGGSMNKFNFVYAEGDQV